MKSLTAFVLASLLMSPVARASNLPWRQNTDELAWQMFVQVVSPAGNPGLNPKVEFETWASDQDIFDSNPAVWPSPNSQKILQNSVLGRSELSILQGVEPKALPPGAGLECPPSGLNDAAKGDPFPASGCVGEEVRRNWASFQYIVSNALDTKAGRVDFARAGKTVDFPSDAIEFKGEWVPVADVARWVNLSESQVRQEYYITSVIVNGRPTQMALVAFHFSSKLTKNWVWADFEHVLNPGRCDTIGCRDTWGSRVREVRPNPRPWEPYTAGCPRTPELSALSTSAGIAQVWNNYCMKATQIDFVATDGSTLLGNSVIEPLAANIPIEKSSCITCHGVALFDKSTGAPYTALLRNSPVGPLPSYDTSKYASYDFVWGLLTGSK